MLTIDTREKIGIINSYVNLYKLYIHKIIDNNTKNSTIYIEIFQKITKTLNNLNNFNNSNNKTIINILENFVDRYIISD